MKNLLLAVLALSACGVPLEIERPVTTVEVQPSKPVERVVAPPAKQLVGQTTFTRTVSDQTTLIDLKLDDQTVFCTEFGYGATFLKVSIPQLDQLAHFDHRVEGTNLPCAAVGECSADMNADNILQGRPGVEQVWVRVVLVAHFEADGDARSCKRQLVEDVSASVRGVPLHHHVEGEWEQVDFGLCAE